MKEFVPLQFKNFTEYLNSRSDGKAVLRYYEEHETLTNALRNELVKMILMDAAMEGIEMNAKFNELMSRKIAAIFPKENPVSKKIMAYESSFMATGDSILSSLNFLETTHNCLQ